MSPSTLNKRDSSSRDVVLTPPWIVDDMLRHFNPTGTILDPCRGEGAFSGKIPSSEWCEITEGRDFFAWHQSVDWVVGNPPYSITREWLRHSYTVAENVLYLLPVRNIFSGYGTLREIAGYGGIAQIRYYGTGNRCGFPMGNAIGAVHIRRGYTGPMVTSYHSDDAASLLATFPDLPEGRDQ